MTTEEKIDKIYTTLVGDKDLRQKGLIERVEDLEREEKSNTLTKAKISGGFVVLSIVGGFVFWALSETVRYLFKHNFQ